MVRATAAGDRTERANGGCCVLFVAQNVGNTPYGAVQLFGKNGYSVGHNGLGAAIDEG